MNVKKLISLSIAALLIVSVTAGCSGGQPTQKSAEQKPPEQKLADTGPIKIGFLGALTGNVASYGINTLKGMKLAVEEINAAGGVLGRPLEIVIEDNRGDKTEIANVTKKFVTRDKVAAVIGDPTTGGTKVAAAICQENKTVLVSAGAVGPGVGEIGDYIFRDVVIDPIAVPAVVKWLKDSLKWKRVALIVSVNNDYSVGQAKLFEDALKKEGIEIAIKESIQDGDTVFTSQVTKIKKANVDGMIAPIYYTEGALLMIEAKKQGLNKVFIGGDGLLSPVLWELAKGATEGCMVFAGFSPDEPDEITKKFIDKVKQVYNEEPDMFHAQGYDAVYLVADAMKRANSADPSVFKTALAQTKDLRGVCGVLTILPNREPLRTPINVLEVKGQKFALKARVPVTAPQ